MSDAGTTQTLEGTVGGTHYSIKITVPAGDPNTLYSTASTLKGHGEDLNTFGTTIGTKGSDVRESAQWSGSAADGYSGVVCTLSATVSKQGTPYATVASAIHSYAGTLEWGQDAARDLISSTQTALKTATPATLQSIVDQANQQAAHITSTVSQAAATAKSQVDGATEEEKGSWTEAMDNNTLWKWVEGAHKAFDSIAGDAWLETLKKGGEDFEKASKALKELWKGVSSLAHDADLTGDYSKVEEACAAAYEDSGMTEAAKTLGIDGETLAKLLPRLRVAGYGLDGVSALGDVMTLVDPPDKSTAGSVIDRSMAGLNLAGMGADLAGESGLIATDGALSAVPVAGEVAIVGTGLYMAGDYLYHHWTPFRNVCNDIGHTTAHVAGDIGHAAAQATDDIGHAASSAFHTVTSWL